MFNISKVTIRRLVVVSTITTLVALGLMVAGIVFPQPLLLVLSDPLQVEDDGEQVEHERDRAEELPEAHGEHEQERPREHDPGHHEGDRHERRDGRDED